MSDVVVVVVAAPGAVPSAVRDVLRDWVTLGLVQPFVWVDADEVGPGAALSSVVGTRLLAEDAPRVRLQDHLANQRSIGLLRLVALGSVGAGQTALVAPTLAGDLNTSLSAVAPGRTVALQCVLTRQGAQGWEEAIAIPGWRTLVLAPEDSWSPSPHQPSTEFAVGGDDGEFIAHCAAGLASVAALWTGVGRGAFDTAAGSNPDPVVFRAFLRRLDTAEVTQRLRRSLTDVSTGLPLPQSGQGRVESLQDPQQGVTKVHQALIDKHPELFTVSWMQPEQVHKKTVTSWEAIKLFFGFLVDAIRSAPGALVERIKGRGAALISARVQEALFGGADSRYEVVTRGVNASGLPPGTRDLSAAADDVRDRLSTVLADEGALPDLSAFWSDAVAGSLSLADAGDHGSSIGPVLVAGNPRVVRNTAFIAPAPADAFKLSPVVAARLGSPRVMPYDARLQQQAADVIEQTGSVSDAVAEDFARWRDRQANSFTGLIGARLASEVEQRTQALSDLIQRLRMEREQVDEGAVGQGLKRVRTILLEYALGLILIAVLVAGLVVLSLITGPLLVLLGALAVLAWTGSQLLRLLTQQRRVFALLNAQQRVEDDLELVSRNVPIAAAALHLSTVMYDQYLAWAPVLGRFLREPFGPLVEAVPPARLRGLLPRAVGFGVATTDDERLQVVSHELGGVVFDRGWLQPLWEALVDDAPRQLGPAGLSLRDDPGALLSDSAASDESILRRWSGLVAEKGVPSGAGDALWARARTALVQRGTAMLGERLLTNVEVQAQEEHGITTALSGREFFMVVTDALEDVDQHYFSPELFTERARAQDRHRVAKTVALGRREIVPVNTGTSSDITWVEPAAESGALDQFLVVVQTSAALRGDELTLRGLGGGAGDGDGPWDEDGPGDEVVV